MGKVKNIGLLDTRKATKDSLSNISEFQNIGTMLYSDDSAPLLSSIQKTNIGSAIKIPDDKEIEFVNINGSLTLDKEFLDGTTKKLFILLNGYCEVKDVSKELFNERVEEMLVNGQIVCPYSLKASVQIRSKFNGKMVAYKDGYRFINETVILNDTFVERQYEKAKLSIKNMVAINKLDESIIYNQISSIQLIDQLIITKGNISILRDIIDDFDRVEIKLVPDNSLYMEQNVLLDHDSIKRYSGKTLVVDGKVNLRNITETELKDHITGIHCDKVYCEEPLFHAVKELLLNNATIKVTNSNQVSNNGKLVITNDYLVELSDMVTFENNGKLVFDSSVNAELVKEKIKGIENRGVIAAKSSVLSNITIANSGKIKPLDETETQVEEDIIYENMGTLVL